MEILHVIPHKENRWAVIGDRSNSIDICEFKAEAIEHASRRAMRLSTDIVIHDSEGQVEYKKSFRV